MGYVVGILGGSLVGFLAVMIGAQVIHNWLTDLKIGNEKRIDEEYRNHKW